MLYDTEGLRYLDNNPLINAQSGGPSLMSALVLLGVVGVLALFFIGTYNGLVRKRIACDGAWSQVDVQLKRRHDLIPNLVETVKGYAKHESKTLEAVVQARNAAVSASGQGPAVQGQAENALSGTLRQLFALQEAYPDLKANQNFLSLQGELSATENLISSARQNYNTCVGDYQGARQAFPSNIIAGWFNFEAKNFFEIDPAEQAAVKTAPKVSFD